MYMHALVCGFAVQITCTYIVGTVYLHGTAAKIELLMNFSIDFKSPTITITAWKSYTLKPQFVCEVSHHRTWVYHLL